MPVRSESRVTIASSVPDVWAYVCDVGRWPEWAPTVRECWVGGGAPLQPGARVEQRAKLIFGSTRHRVQVVTVVDPPGHTVSKTDSTRDRLIETYRKRAKHYDITSRFYPAPGYPQRAQRLRAVQALRLRPGDSVVDIACGTGLNFSLIEQAIGPDGRIAGVDLTDAMLAQAQDRIETNGWSNISLVQADAADFDFPTEVDAILSTYALSQVPECAEVIAHGAAATSGGGRWVVLDLKVPGNTPGWLAQLGTAIGPPFASIDEWIMRRPWQAIHTAMQEELADLTWTELFFGTAFIAAGSRGPGDRRQST